MGETLDTGPVDCDVHCAPASWEALDPYLTPAWRHHVERGRVPLTSVPDLYPESMRTTGGPVPQDLARRVPAAGADHAAAGVRRRAAQVQALHRRAVVGEARRRPQAEQLRQPHRPLEDVAARQPERPLQV